MSRSSRVAFWLVASGAVVGGCAEPQPVPAPAPAGRMQPFDRADLSNLCAKSRCRPASHLRRVGDTGADFDIDLPPAPYVLGHETVRVIPGDDFFLAADERNGVLVGLRYIDPPPSGTKNLLHIQFRQTALDNGPRAMILTVDNSFEHRLVYRASSHLAAWLAGTFKDATTCPVRPAITSSEVWSQAISAVLLGGFRFDDAARTCRIY